MSRVCTHMLEYRETIQAQGLHLYVGIQNNHMVLGLHLYVEIQENHNSVSICRNTGELSRLRD